MFLDKLWVRLRGEVIALKEEVSSSTDLRDKAESLLRKLEERLGAPQPERDASSEVEPEGRRVVERAEARAADSRALSDLKKELEELKKLRQPKEGEQHEAEPIKPNPRRLG